MLQHIRFVILGELARSTCRIRRIMFSWIALPPGQPAGHQIRFLVWATIRHPRPWIGPNVLGEVKHETSAAKCTKVFQLATDLAASLSQAWITSVASFSGSIWFCFGPLDTPAVFGSRRGIGYRIVWPSRHGRHCTPIRLPKTVTQTKPGRG